MRRFHLRHVQFTIQQKLVLACLSMALIISMLLFVYYGKVHRDALEQQVQYYEKNHEQTAVLLNSLEQKINSYYHQLVNDNNNLAGILVKSEYGKDDYFTLYQIQRGLINIINSEPVIDSIYLYSYTSDKALSTKYMFANLDYFPDHVVINQFYAQKKAKLWFPARYERAGDPRSPQILSWVAGIPFNARRGAIVFNVDQRKLLAGLGNKQAGLVVLDDQDQTILHQNNDLYRVFKKNQAKILATGQKTQLVRITDWGHRYYVFVTQNTHTNWQVISIIPDAIIRAGTKNNSLDFYLIVAFLLASAFGLAKLVQTIYTQSIQSYQDKFQTNINSLIDSFVVGVLTGEYTREEIADKSVDLGMQWRGERFLTVVYQIDNYYSFLLENREYLPRMLLNKKIQNDIKATFGETQTAVVTVEMGKIVVLLGLEREQSETAVLAEVEQRIGDSQTQIERAYHLSVRVAVSEILTGVEQIQICYAQALKALSFKNFSHQNSLIRYQEVAAHTALAPNYPVTEIALLKEYIKSGNQAKIGCAIDQICQNLLAQPYLSVDLVNAIFSNIFYEIIKVVLEFGYSLKDVYGEEDLFITLYSYEMIEEKKEFFLKVAGRLVEYRNSKEKNSHKLVVQRIIDYIEENYDKTISLEIVGAEVGMNPSYLSSFIKKELGVYFVDYVIELRLKKALCLLKEEKLNIKQIAERCGFDTVHSFIRNFKKRYQVTPSEFRNQGN